MVKANPTTATNLNEKMVRHKRPGGCKTGACGGGYPKPCNIDADVCDGYLHAEVASDVGDPDERWLYVRCTTCGRNGTEEDL